jgi:sterol desaturase/sphingolipid hydroxylase (fatty acid hydroxylase superfamily)
MPESKKRKTHPHHHSDFVPHIKKKKSVTPYTMLFFALFAAGIAFFAMGSNAYWLIGLSVLIGLGVGYYAGLQVDKAIAERGNR